MRQGGDPQTPEQRLRNYCTAILTSVERVHFDYKCKENDQTPTLGESDKRNLAKAISGFANSGGGVLLWGIKEETGKPLEFRPMSQVETFLKNLMELGGLATDPAVPGFDGDWISSDDNPVAGYAATFVPESPLPPHRVVLKIDKVQHRYYIRSGSGFAVASHSQLEDMFGRRPRAKLTAVVRSDFPFEDYPGAHWDVVFDVVNEGRATAKRVCVEFPSRPGMWGHDGPDWRHLGGTSDAATGRESVVFELVPMRVIHPGMAMRFSGLRLGRSHFASGEYVRLECVVYSDGCAPARCTIEGTLEPAHSRESA